jgi:hypothetical protein
VGVECTYDNGKVFTSSVLVFLCVPHNQLASVAHDIRQHYTFSKPVQLHLFQLKQEPQHQQEQEHVQQTPSTPSLSTQVNSKCAKPFVCSVVLGAKTKKLSQMFGVEQVVQTTVIAENFVASLECISLTKPKTRFSQAMCEATLPVRNISQLQVDPQGDASIILSATSYINSLASSLALLASRLVCYQKALQIASKTVLGTDVGLGPLRILLNTSPMIGGGDDGLLYRAAKASSEAILNAFRQNYMGTLLQ